MFTDQPKDVQKLLLGDGQLQSEMADQIKKLSPQEAANLLVEKLYLNLQSRLGVLRGE